MNRALLFAVCIAMAAAGPAWAQSPCPTMTPEPTPTIAPGEIINSSAAVRPGDPFQSMFRLNQGITQPFTAYAVVVMPDGFMLDALTLGPTIRPVASNVPSLAAPFLYPLLSLLVPAGAPLGSYEVLVGFFDPAKPITKPEDAFLLARGPFRIVTVIPTPTPTAIPNISGPWTGRYVITTPAPCNENHNGRWDACVQMAADGSLSGHFGTTPDDHGDTPVEGDIDGTFDGDTATWTVQGTVGLIYTGTVQTSGMTISGTFSDGPTCGPSGAPVAGTFNGVRQ